MGVGKTTVGPIVAKALSWNFIDTDTMIEKKSGKSIAKIFATEGENRFREWEGETVLEIAARERLVVSLGGGALIPVRNQDRIRRGGILIYLRASVKTLLERVKGIDRPLLKGLQGEALEKEMTALILAREPLYKLASITIDTDGKTPDAVAQEIVSEVSKWKRS